MSTNNIKKIRNEKNLSLQELADLSGVAKSTIYDAESGKVNPTMNTLGKIASALNVPISELLGEESNDKITEYQNQNKLFFSKFGKLSEKDKSKIIKMIEIFEEETQD